MPHKDPEKRKASQQERSRRHRAKKHAERYGPGAGSQSGRHGNHACGSNNGRWNDGRMISTEGYVLIRVGADHPLAFGNGYAYEHLLVWTAAGKPLPKDNELIHHKDEDKTNNRLDNLELETRSDHAKHHDQQRGRDHLGRFPPAPVPEVSSCAR